MSELTFRCPYSNKLIHSGVYLEAETAQMMRRQSIRVRCPHCNATHDGLVADGALSDAPAEWGDALPHSIAPGLP